MSATIAHVWIGILIGVSFVAVPVLRDRVSAAKEARPLEPEIYSASSWLDRLVWLALAGAIVLEGVSWWAATAMPMMAAIFFYQGAFVLPRLAQAHLEDHCVLVKRHQILDVGKISLLISLILT